MNTPSRTDAADSQYSPDAERSRMFDTATGPGFCFPRPVAYLLAVLWEPRTGDQTHYPRALLLEIESVRQEIRRELQSLKSEGPLVQQTGSVEALLRPLLPPLRQTALNLQQNDVAYRLKEADQVSRGERALPSNPRDHELPSLPDRKSVLPGRPPVGFWR